VQGPWFSSALALSQLCGQKQQDDGKRAIREFPMTVHFGGQLVKVG
jgi:hypothetical protein